MHVNGLWTDTEKLDLLYILNNKKLALQEVRHLLELREGVSIPHQGEIDTKYVTKGVIYRNGPGTRRKLTLMICHAPSEFIPHLGKVVLSVLVLYVHMHQGHAAA